jgi:hypothetical protein
MTITTTTLTTTTTTTIIRCPVWKVVQCCAKELSC